MNPLVISCSTKCLERQLWASTHTLMLCRCILRSDGGQVSGTSSLVAVFSECPSVELSTTSDLNLDLFFLTLPCALWKTLWLIILINVFQVMTHLSGLRLLLFWRLYCLFSLFTLATPPPSFPLSWFFSAPPLVIRSFPFVKRWISGVNKGFSCILSILFLCISICLCT